MPRSPIPSPYYTAESLEPMNSIGFLIKRCGVLMGQLAERRFESQPVSFTQWLVLIRLRFHAHMSATQISDEMGYDMGALTRVVDALEAAGFVRRERSQRDRRAVEIALTAEGRRQVDGTMHFVVDLLNQLVAPYSRKEIEGFIVLLQRLLLRLQELAAAEAGATAAGDGGTRSGGAGRGRGARHSAEPQAVRRKPGRGEA